MKSMKRGWAVLLAALLVIPNLPAKAAGAENLPVAEFGYDRDAAASPGESGDEPGRDEEGASGAGNGAEGSGCTADSAEDGGDAAGIPEKAGDAGRDPGTGNGPGPGEPDGSEPDGDASQADGSGSGAGDGAAELDEEENGGANLPEEGPGAEGNENVSHGDGGLKEDAVAGEDNSPAAGNGTEGNEELPDGGGEPGEGIIAGGTGSGEEFPIGGKTDEGGLPPEGETDKEGSASYVAAIIGSGTLETGLRWALDEAGTLTISGTGAMPDYDGYAHAPWHEERQLILKVAIGSGVSRVGDFAFYGCGALTAVELADSVEAIGQGAFSSCSSLSSVNMGNGLKDIEYRAFESCNALTAIAIPASVETIGDLAFYGCSSLASVNLANGLKDIEWRAFGACKALAGIAIPDSVETIGNWAFYGCTALSSVDLGNGLKHIELGAFESCTALTAIAIPDSVETIGRSAFGSCTSLASVTIGSGVSGLSGIPFERCEALKEVVINGNPNYIVEDGIIFTSDRTTLVEYLPNNDRSSYAVPDSVTKISYGAFSSNYSLKEVGLPQNLKEIEDWAFARTRLNDISIPAQTEIIGTQAFYDSCQEVFCYARNAEVWYEALYNPLGVTAYGFEGSTTQEYVKDNSSWYKLKFVPISESGTEQGLPIGVKYVPYEVSLRSIMGYMQDASYALVDGSLPGGMVLGSDGLITGTPAQTGRFAFTVQRHNSDSAETVPYLLEVRDNTDVNVEDMTDLGYGLTEYVPDLNLGNLAQSYTLCSIGSYGEFRDVYLDGRKLEAGTEYTSEAGSTRITIMAQTLAGNGTGTHTIGIEFRTGTGKLKRAAQNYTLADTENPDGGNNGENSGSGDSGNGSGGNGNGEGGNTGGQNGNSLTESSESMPSAVTYIVQPGDNLWKIAAIYYGSGRYWNRIYQDNIAVIQNPNRLRPGQALTIYVDAPDRVPAQGNTLREGTSYVVQPGDSLWMIAARVYGNGNLWRRIYLANQHLIRNREIIFARQVLFIPNR